MYREWKKIGFPKEYCIWIWKQQDQEADQEIYGWMKWGRMEESLAERSGRKKCMIGRNGGGSWERQGITAFCTCQWIDWLIDWLSRILSSSKSLLQTQIRTPSFSDGQDNPGIWSNPATSKYVNKSYFCVVKPLFLSSCPCWNLHVHGTRLRRKNNLIFFPLKDCVTANQ